MKNLAYQEEIISFFTRLITLAVLLWIIFGMVFGLTPMENDDMSPRISAGDLMLYYRLDREFISDDIIVFEKDGQQYTGRIVARGGDSVEVTDDAELVVNGGIVMDSDIFYFTPKYDENVTYPVQLAENEYFVLCDYREGARDSRYFGPVSADEIKGKVITVIRRSNL
ncbi:signal peptidase I [Lachnoclostridium sp. An169]|nr:signal peptidase I [Lachnoclostridium sp. An169]HJA65565.1 signal peptidase I [Candidatus Mediterraneibacter cottocaccae]